MKILTVDIGTGTQDIFLYDSRLDLENGLKLILPSPTMMINWRIKAATRSSTPILLTGVTMGGGPSQWAAEAHARLGFPVYATPEAARTFDDDLAKVQEMGIRLVSEDEAARLPDSVLRIELRDFDLPAIIHVLAGFEVSLQDLQAVAVAVFDHGAAPPDVSDRQFRFDYLDRRIRSDARTAARYPLSTFAFLASDIPAIMTRFQAVAASARGVDVPLVVMDSAPAAVLGATFDPIVAARDRKLIANIGNFHTLAFRLGLAGIEGMFEHHTGLIDSPKLDTLLRALAAGSLRHADVFDDHGHGALIYDPDPLPLGQAGFDVTVTGPRRNLMRGSTLHPYFAVPFGDMMLSGCFGLLAAAADLIPEISEPVRASLDIEGSIGVSPWDVDG
jgi:uncharacterized protein (DUF1786 family)